MKNEKRIVLNRIKTPDGTILTSHSRHDYVVYTDSNGFRYSVDGGNDYLKRSFQDGAPHCKELSVYSDSPFEEIRKSYHRGGTITGVLKWVPLNEMSNKWLANCIDYNIDKGFEKDCFPNQMYQRELDYRKKKDIFIPDDRNDK